MKQPSSATFLMPLAGQPFANRFSRFRRGDSSSRGKVRGEPPSGTDGHVQSAGERRESLSLIRNVARCAQIEILTSFFCRSNKWHNWQLSARLFSNIINSALRFSGGWRKHSWKSMSDCMFLVQNC